jgi:2-polyprenyl-6-methoxyphenol hydroxylase-like FAD-dependent oxidoreductase
MVGGCRVVTPPRHAEIVGAGMAGLTVAAALSQRGWSVRVHERMGAVRTVGSGLSIFENALRVMRAIGAEADAVRGARRGYERETRDAQGRTTSHLAYATTMYEITREQVVAALASAARRLGAEIVTGSTAIAVGAEGSITLEGGTTAKADLVIVADGAGSRLRDTLGIPWTRKWLTDGAIRIVVPRRLEELTHPDAQKNIEYWSGHRRILIAPCSDTELYVALTTLDRDEPAKRLPIDKALWTKSFPTLGALIDRLNGEARWDRFVVVKMKRWSAGRVVVIGDAAHAMAPNLGQGGACAMMNALGLAVELDCHSDIVKGLGEWERRERPLTDHTQRLSSFYSALTVWPDALRSAAFWTTSRSKWLRKQYLRTALHVPTGTEAFPPAAAERRA